MVERKLFSDIKIEVGYVGTGTRNQFGDLEHQRRAGAETAAPVRVIGRTASTLLWDGFATPTITLSRWRSTAATPRSLLKGAYTWSKAINFIDDRGWAGLPLFNAASEIGRNRALAGYDIPHNVQIGAAYELPFGKAKSA